MKPITTDALRENSKMANALATTNDAPAAFGSRNEIRAVADRIQTMLPSARLADWQLRKPPQEREEAQKNLDDSLYRAAQICVFYRLVPGEDVHIIPFGNSFAVDMGIETWKKAADRYASLHGITYHIHTEDMPADMVKERRGDLYHPEDVGVIAYLWRSDKAGVYEIFGAKEAMTKGYGVWAKKARYNKGSKEWDADTIPTQRTKHDVARRRAMKMVLKAEFSLDSLLAANPGELRRNTEEIERQYDGYRREHAISARRDAVLDEDGVFVVEDRPYVQAGEAPDIDDIIDAETRPVDEVDNPFEDKPSLADLQKFVSAMRSMHKSSDGGCTKRQYGYLVGLVDAVCERKDEKDAHGAVLSYLCDANISSGNYPGANVADNLLKHLPTHIKDESGESVANPNYKPAYTAAVQWVYAQTQAAQQEAA